MAQSNIEATLRALAARTAAKKSRTLERTEKRHAKILGALRADVAQLAEDAKSPALSLALRNMADAGLTKAMNRLATMEERASAIEEALKETIDALEQAS